MSPRLHILLIEDDLMFVERLQELITEHPDYPCHITHERQLDRAVSRCQQEPIDVIFLSLHPSDGQNRDAIAALQQVVPDVSIVTLINTDNDELGLESLQQGAQDYLPKPTLTYTLLERSLRYVTELAQSRKQLHAAEQRLVQLLEERIAERTEKRTEEGIEERTVPYVSEGKSDRQPHPPESRQAELALSASEATTRAIIRAIPDLLIWMEVNHGYQKILGGDAVHAIYPSPNLVNPSIYDILPEELADRRMYYAQRANDTGELQIYEQEIEISNILVWEEIRIIKLHTDEVLVIVRDITDRKQADMALQQLNQLNQQLEVRVAQRTTALRESEERFRQIFEQSPVGIAISDLDGRLTRVNASLASIVNSSTAELLQKSIYTILQATEQESPIQLQQLLDHTLTVASFENQAVAKNGATLWVNVTSALIFNALGRPSSVVYLIEDISDRKRAEDELHRINERLTLTNAELYRATRLKDEFLANMSHELRTPLNAILGMAEGLQEEVFGSLSDRQKRSIGTIERSGQHLLELIDDILDLSKIEAGKLELQIAPIPVRYLCETSLTFVRQQALKKQIQITTEIPQNLPDVVLDERRIRQVLINLLSNAIKFTPEGGKVKLVAHPQEHMKMLRISVTDTGIGIADEDLKKLFQPFIQIDSSLNRQHSGTGLGLALVRRLVELHQGNVSVESTVGEGSSFTIWLPYLIGNSAATVASLPLAESAMPSANVLPIRKPQALIIEDSVVAAEQIIRYLNEVGIQAYLHGRGEGAVDEAVRLQPGLIILDLQLPGLSGWDVLQQLKHHQQTQDIPVLVTSVVDEQTKGLAQGASAYLVKPINRNQLCKALHHLNYLTEVETPPAIADPNAVATPTAIAPSGLILLAEDNEANIVTMSNYLMARGYRLILAKDGQSAIDLAISSHPDLILMDVQMAGMDGLEAVQRLRSDPQFDDTPIIVLTALAMSGDREKCLDVGANDYFTKPVKLKHLVEKIQHLLEKRKVNNR